MQTSLRPAVVADAEACGRILHDAFNGIAQDHGFPTDFETVEVAIRVVRYFIRHPRIFGVVAERAGRIVGANFLREDDEIRAVGPISVDPGEQGRGVGRQLMEAVLARARGASGVRLVQDAFNTCSMSLYVSLGFAVKEPLVMLRGKPHATLPAPVAVRPLRREDLGACASLCRRVHGIERTGELEDALRHFAPVVVERAGRITAYATTLAISGFAHGVAETDADLHALVLGAGASGPEPVSFFLPTRQMDLFRWCLAEGLRVVKPATLMAIGRYHEASGPYFPSGYY